MEEPLVDLGKYVKFVEEYLTNKFGLNPELIEYASNATGVISGIATVAGYFAERNENRKIIGELNPVQFENWSFGSKSNRLIKRRKIRSI
ncbi:hypothetical protein [Myxosarcina sp. GI1]|uniref:hypothetical protein n=1 Tax=Myxosarcina sp. GI1 TaxID=1541065 RepID=UPI000567642B|nr:hypothetical protein [Myxosarcina sp. GI1]